MKEDVYLEVMFESQWVSGKKFHLQASHPTRESALDLIRRCHGKRATFQEDGRVIDVYDPAFADGFTRYRIR